MSTQLKESGMPQGELGIVFEWMWHYSPVGIGAVGGYLYYRFVGCKSGACPITGNPWISTLYGALIGALLIPH